jgi:nitroreductase
MKVVKILGLAAGLFVLAGALAMADDLKLPPPQTEGGIGIFEALKKRSSASGGDFSIAELSQEELSTVLWAASGLNRGEKGWTVPMSKGASPYCKVYVVGSAGVWLYDWASHGLKEISKENLKAKIGEQDFVKRASHILVIVSDPAVLEQFKDPAIRKEFAEVLTGAMTQNVYLAAASLNLGARYIHGMDVPAIKKGLELAEGEEPICLMLIGK